MNRSVYLIFVFLLALFVSACEDPAAEEKPAVEEDPEYSIEGSYKTFYDMIILISGDEGVVTDFGKNELGTNPSVFNLGDPYFKDLKRVSKNKYTGKVVKATTKWNNTTLKNVVDKIEYVDTEIEVKETEIDPTVSNSWDISFKKVASSSGGNPGSGGGGSSGGGGGSTGGTDNLKWSDWLFVQSDKALQYRFSRVSGSGEGIYKIKVQYRINKTDAIHCTNSTCLGYIYWGGFYSKPGGNYDAQYRFYFPNNFTGNTPGMPGVYTLPQTVSIEIKTYTDGKRIWDEAKQLPFVVFNNGYKQQIYLADNCVDNKLSNTSSHRCNDYSKGSSVTIN